MYKPPIKPVIPEEKKTTTAPSSGQALSVPGRAASDSDSSQSVPSRTPTPDSDSSRSSTTSAGSKGSTGSTDSERLSDLSLRTTPSLSASSHSSSDSERKSTEDPIKVKVLKQLTQDFWHPDVGIIVNLAKRERRNLTGRAFDSFVVTRPTTEIEGKSEATLIKSQDQLFEVIEIIKKRLDSCLVPRHFQLNVYVYPHWTLFDLYIKNRELKVFCFDAFNDAKADPSLALFKQRIPKCTAIIFEADTKGMGTGKLRRVQVDEKSCSRYTFDAANVISKSEFTKNINPSQLKTKLYLTETKFDGVDDKKGKHSGPQIELKVVSSEYLLKHAPELFRNVGSREVFKTFTTEEKKRRVSVGKVLSQEEYFNEYSRPSTLEKNEGQLVPHAIYHKKERFSEHVEQFCQRHPTQISALCSYHKQSLIEFLNLDDTQYQTYTLQQQTQYPLREVALNIVDKLLRDYDSRINIEQKKIIKLSSQLQEVKDPSKPKAKEKDQKLNERPLTEKEINKLVAESEKEIKRLTGKQRELQNVQTTFATNKDMDETKPLQQQLNTFENLTKHTPMPAKAKKRLKEIHAKYVTRMKLDLKPGPQAEAETKSLQAPKFTGSLFATRATHGSPASPAAPVAAPVTVKPLSGGLSSGQSAALPTQGGTTTKAPTSASTYHLRGGGSSSASARPATLATIPEDSSSIRQEGLTPVEPSAGAGSAGSKTTSSR